MLNIYAQSAKERIGALLFLKIVGAILKEICILKMWLKMN
jgi:hypothetical protein